MIKHIIFDLGGVLLNIDYGLTIQSFNELGIPHFETVFSKFRQDRISDDFECGVVTDEGFRNHIRSLSGVDFEDRLIDQAWNTMLLDFPLSRLEMLKVLKKEGFQLFLLSNTNIIHYREFSKRLNSLFGEPLERFFTKTYYSHEVGLRKPDKKIFGKVLNDFDLQAVETLYIEDSPQHVSAARELGIDCLLMNTNGDTVSLVKQALAKRRKQNGHSFSQYGIEKLS